MAINKVVDRNNNTLIDLTMDTVTPNKVLSGVTFHKADGTVATGMLEKSDIDTLKYKFFDYDGTLLYSYTDEELDALTELPAGADHTDENLTFQGWNWDLDDLKNWDRTRLDRPVIGSHYITTDGKSYLYFDIPFSNKKITIYSENRTNAANIDWGDGTIETITSTFDLEHTYANPGEYIVVLDINGSWSAEENKFLKKVRHGNGTTMGNFRYCEALETVNVPKGIKLSNYQCQNCRLLKFIIIPNGVETITDQLFSSCSSLKSISIPKSITRINYGSLQSCYNLTNIVFPDGVVNIGQYALSSCSSLKNITIPDGTTTIESYAFQNCYSLKNILIPDSIQSIGNSVFTYCSSLTSITIPNNVTSIGRSTFSNCYSLTNITIPDSVTSIGSSAFSECSILRLDLSEQTKVINLTGSISFSTTGHAAIFVPASLLDAYKSASYWSQYANYMVGV